MGKQSGQRPATAKKRQPSQRRRASGQAPKQRPADPAQETALRADVSPQAALAGVDPALQQRLIQRVQRAGGNRQAGRLIARYQDETAATRTGAGLSVTESHDAAVSARANGGPATARAASPPAIQRAGTPTQADQEEKAKKATKRINKILKGMLKSDKAIVRNTAQLFTMKGSDGKSRLDFKTMTVRSDSASKLAAAGHDATKYNYYFYGETQDNQHLHGVRTIGTVEGDSTLIIRERDSSGAKQSKTDIIATIVHEAAHMLAEVYGDYPASTGDADSFDRYKDEFRAYWIEPVGSWAKIKDPDKKAEAIKEQLVGTSATSTKGYKQLRDKYWSDAAFKAQVDAHTRPDGYNLTHNPNLDRLAVLIAGVKAGTATVDTVLLHVVRYMTPAERKEAVENAYFKIGGKANTDLGLHFARVKNTLRDLSQAWFDAKLDPNGSRKMRYFLSAIAVRNETAIVVNYEGLSAKEKGRLLYETAPYLVFVDQRIPDLMVRAATYALMSGYGPTQYQATKRLLQACARAKTDGDTTMPADIRAAFNQMTLRSRLSLYRLAEPARQKYVDVLPEAISKPLLRGLRADSDTI